MEVVAFSTAVKIPTGAHLPWQRAADVQEFERRIEKMRYLIHAQIYELVQAGVPKTSLARQVGLSPQRINSIIHEQEAKRAKRKKR